MQCLGSVHTRANAAETTGLSRTKSESNIERNPIRNEARSRQRIEEDVLHRVRFAR